LHRNTNAYPPALERVLAAKMQSKLTVALTHAATFWRASRLFKVPRDRDALIVGSDEGEIDAGLITSSHGVPEAA
jgi:hypothetical protein